MKIVDGTLTNNGIADVLSRTPPKLRNTTCGKSMDFNSNSWGACNGSPSGAFID